MRPTWQGAWEGADLEIHSSIREELEFVREGSGAGETGRHSQDGRDGLTWLI